MKATVFKKYFIHIILFTFVICFLVYYSLDKEQVKAYQQLKRISYSRKIFGKYCNTFANKLSGEEGLFHLPDYQLSSIGVFIRHGDRPPISPPHNLNDGLLNFNYRNLSPKDLCHPMAVQDPELQRYIKRMTSINLKASEIGWPCLRYRLPFLRPSEILPPLNCWTSIGMTLFGVGQNIKLGRYLANRYLRHKSVKDLALGLNFHLHSTMMQRTYQSALAVSFGLLDDKNFRRLLFSQNITGTCPITFHSSHLFCHNGPLAGGGSSLAKANPNSGGFCPCVEAKRVRHHFEPYSRRLSTYRLSKMAHPLGKRHHMRRQKLGAILFPEHSKHHFIASHGSRFRRKGIPNSPYVSRTLFDTLAAPICHDPKFFSQPTGTEAGPANRLLCRADSCAGDDHVRALVADLRGERNFTVRDPSYLRLSALQSRSILAYVVERVLTRPEASSIPNIHLFSGHDTTLEPLLTVLAGNGPFVDTSLVPYSSRLIFELWTSPLTNRPPMVRVLYNGLPLKLGPNGSDSTHKTMEMNDFKKYVTNLLGHESPTAGMCQ